MTKKKLSKNKKEINGINAYRYNYIKPFVNFRFKQNVKFTGAQTNKVKRYYREIRRLVGRPTKIWTPNLRQGKNESKRHFNKRYGDTLRHVQEFSQHNFRYPNINVAFIPTPYKNAKIKFDKNGNIVLQNKYVEETAIKFPNFKIRKNLEAFLADIIGYINKVIKPWPKKTEFSLRIGKSQMRASYPKKFIAAEIAKIIERYQAKDDRLASNIWGLSVYTFKNQNMRNSYHQKRLDYYERHHKKNPLRAYRKRKRSK